MFEEKHEMIRKLAREFAENELAPRAAEVDETGVYPEEVLALIHRSKFHAVTIPKEYGGSGGEYRSAAIVTEEFARKCATSCSPIMPNSLSGAPLMYFGNEQQKQKYLRGMANGTMIGAFCIT